MPCASREVKSGGNFAATVQVVQMPHHKSDYLTNHNASTPSFLFDFNPRLVDLAPLTLMNSMMTCRMVCNHMRPHSRRELRSCLHILDNDASFADLSDAAANANTQTAPHSHHSAGGYITLAADLPLYHTLFMVSVSFFPSPVEISLPQMLTKAVGGEFLGSRVLKQYALLVQFK